MKLIFPHKLKKQYDTIDLRSNGTLNQNSNHGLSLREADSPKNKIISKKHK